MFQQPSPSGISAITGLDGMQRCDFGFCIGGFMSAQIVEISNTKADGQFET